MRLIPAAGERRKDLICMEVVMSRKVMVTLVGVVLILAIILLAGR